MTHEEEITLRELAAGRCTIQKVIDQLGPMSLWSNSGMKAEIQRAVEAEREACAKVVDHILKEGGGTYGDAIRARGNT
jgi:hypothetical protein